MRGLEGRVAVVTGGARGLGKVAVERLAEEGMKVGVLDLLEDEAQEVAQAVGGAIQLPTLLDELHRLGGAR